ncbi:MAG: Pr6Pr family membrane protein [Propionibacteriaceae bacterium]|nr:Pr6Pr family membrane protein [Propionibacteriaceae bacterium]
MKHAWARGWHGVTLAVVVATLLLQLGLVVQGQSVLDESTVPPLGTRLWRLASYFTIQSNVLVAIAAATLVRNPERDGPVWRVLRIDAVLGITLTGLVHFFLLRPLLNLKGLNAVADTGLHLVVPALALTGWLAFGPRPRLSASTVLWSLLWPIAWLIVTLVVGAATQWYPYPFLDVGAQGYAPVLITCVAVTLVFLVLAAIAWWADARLPRARVLN